MRRAWCLAVALLVACVPAALAEPLRLLLDGTWGPQHAPYFVAIEHGYFARADIEPNLEIGRNSATLAVMVGQRAFDLGETTASAAASAIGRGVPIRVIAVYQPRISTAIVGIQGRVRLLVPRSVEGLRIGMTPGSTDSLAMTIFRRSNNIAASTITSFPLEAAAKVPALLAARVDVVVGDAQLLGAALIASQQQPEVLDLADNGVPLMGFGFVANRTFLAENAALTRRALVAIRAGFSDAAADPARACELTLARTPMVETQENCVAKLRSFLARVTPASAPDWGRQPPEAWARMIEVLKVAGEIQGTRPASAYYTNEYLP